MDWIGKRSGFNSGLRSEERRVREESTDVCSSGLLVVIKTRPPGMLDDSIRTTHTSAKYGLDRKTVWFQFRLEIGRASCTGREYRRVLFRSPRRDKDSATGNVRRLDTDDAYIGKVWIG